MLEPDYPPHASFDDPELALAHARAIYDAGVAHLRQHLAAFVAGQVPGERVRACYPMVRVQVDTVARADSPRVGRWRSQSL